MFAAGICYSHRELAETDGVLSPPLHYQVRLSILAAHPELSGRVFCRHPWESGQKAGQEDEDIQLSPVELAPSALSCWGQNGWVSHPYVCRSPAGTAQ